MILMKEISKTFDEIVAVNGISLKIQDGIIFGFLGTNGAGKSTLLRMLAGVIKADDGAIIVDGEDSWQNKQLHGKIFYISDDQFYFPNSTPEELAKYYKVYYPEFDMDRYAKILEKFDLAIGRKIKTFSKGMKKQLSIIIGICSNAKYLLCDETFDGLDPVMRQGIKSILAKEMERRDLTPIIASHNLRELEDICDSIGVLHEGGILLSKDLDELKNNFLRVQCVLPEEYDDELRCTLDVIKMTRHGKLVTMTVKGKREEIIPVIEGHQPIYFEALPLSLEEIFISEMEVVGYDIKALIL